MPARDAYETLGAGGGVLNKCLYEEATPRGFMKQLGGKLFVYLLFRFY